MIKWNDKLRLIISDVDETIADLFVPADPLMIKELEKLLKEGKILFFISGQSIQSIRKRIIDFLPKELKNNILVGPCSGVEVWGFKEGKVLENPFYSHYNNMIDENQAKKWREIINQLIEEFKLDVFPTGPLDEFKKINHPLSIMMEDRGPQITFEVVNGYNMTINQVQELGLDVPLTNDMFDIRSIIIERAKQLLEAENLPITPRMAGVFAIDFALKGVSKTTAVKYVFENQKILDDLGLSDLKPNEIEVWGDKFSVERGGTDRHISEGLPKEVRSVDFRDENPAEFLPEYNMVLWDGEKHLHEGLLEFLQSRN